MYKTLFVTLALISAGAFCAEAQTDSLQIQKLSEAVVVGSRAPKDAPFAVSSIDRAQLSEFSHSGKELPMLLSRTPGVMGWSENGLGTGTCYLRIRGAGDSRINVSLDGVPLNSPEDQCVFWANMNSYSAFVGDIQLQRGVGSSTSGDGAFGGAVSLVSRQPSHRLYNEISASYGSYGTMHYGLNGSTGLLGKHLILDYSLHATSTDGYIHGTAGTSGSGTLALHYLGKNFLLTYRNIANAEHTGQAWNGVTAGTDDLSLMDGTYGAATGIKTYSDLYALGLGRYNSLYESLTIEGSDWQNPANYTTRRHEMSDGSLWPRTVDNFRQDHNILSASFDLSEALKMSAALHYTYGYGYYSEFRPQNKLKKFGLANFTKSDGSVLKKTDFVREKGLSQNTGGLLWNLSYKRGRWDVIGGVSAQYFWGNHFGYLTYVADPDLAAVVLDADGRYRYYDSDAAKSDACAFVKLNYRMGENLAAFADLQYRHVGYRTDGVNDKFYALEDGSYANQRLDIDKKYDFFNPKAGLNWQRGSHRAYASVALAHREPERNNFTDNGAYPAPQAESLLDYEAGYEYSARRMNLAANFYYMDYTNQFVQTGALSDIGEALTTNIKDSYRFGVELSAAYKLCDWLTLEGNAALSRSRLRDFDEVVEDWDNSSTTIHYDNSALAYSPEVLLNGFVDLHYKGWSAVLHSGHVGRQYLDNSECEDRSLPAYTRTDLSLSWFKTLRKGCVKALRLGVDFGNIFDAHYAASGWVYSAICESAGHPADNRYYQIGFIPSAGFTAMANIAINF